MDQARKTPLQEQLRSIAVPMLASLFEGERQRLAKQIDQKLEAFTHTTNKTFGDMQRRLVLPVTPTEELQNYVDVGVPERPFGKPDETYFRIDPNTNTVVEIYKKVNGTWQVQGQFPSGSITINPSDGGRVAVGSSTPNLSPYQTHTLTGAIDGVNDVFVSSEPLGALIHGQSAVLTYNGARQWDWAYNEATSELTVGAQTGWRPKAQSQGHELMFHYFPRI